MDAYPTDYVFHNLPLVLLSGIEAQHDLQPLAPVQHVLPGKRCTTVNSDIPLLTTDRGKQLLQEFLNVDGSDAPWNGRPESRKGSLIGFRFRTAGRVGQAPLRSMLFFKCSSPLELCTAAPESRPPCDV